MKSRYYVTNDAGEPVAANVQTWAKGFDGERHVGLTEIPPDVKVSTVFLGLDHSFGSGSPVLWETMIFGGPNDGYQERYTSKADALAGHKLACRIARGEETPDNT